MLDEPVTMGHIAVARHEPAEDDDQPVDDDEEMAVGKALLLHGSVPTWEGILHLHPDDDGRHLFDLYTDPHG